MYSPENFYLKDSNKEVNIGRAIKNGTYIEALVVNYNSDKDVILRINNKIKGIISRDEMEYKLNNDTVSDKSIASKVGKIIKCIPLKIESGVVICSRRQLQKECYDNYISKLIPGDIIDARVTRVEDFGLFCDIGCGWDAFIYSKNISINPLVSLKDELKDIKNIKAIVKSNISGRLELTHKELLGTFREESSKFRAGDLVIGTVISIKDYGIFIRLSQNLAGLADLYTNEQLNPGDTVSVKIISIRDDTLKIKLRVVNKIESEIKPINFEYRGLKKYIDKWSYSNNKNETIFKKE